MFVMDVGANGICFLHSVNGLMCVTGKHCAFFEARNKHVNIIYANFRLKRVRLDAL
jgi:hypothetical protein